MNFFVRLLVNQKIKTFINYIQLWRKWLLNWLNFKFKVVVNRFNYFFLLYKGALINFWSTVFGKFRSWYDFLIFRTTQFSHNDDSCYFWTGSAPIQKVFTFQTLKHFSYRRPLQNTWDHSITTTHSRHHIHISTISLNRVYL